MKIPSLFMLNIPDRVQKRVRAAVLFPVSVKGKNVVLATASHTVIGLTGEYEMILSDADGRRLPATTIPTKTMILPPTLGMDIAFLETQMDELPMPVRLSDQAISKGTTLSHARNVLLRGEFEDQTYVVNSQTVSPLSRRFTFDLDRFVEASEQVALAGRVYRNPLRGLAMRSWPGVSGSPIWDKFGNVLGMVCGGNEELTEAEPEFYVVYLPAKAIKEGLRMTQTMRATRTG